MNHLRKNIFKKHKDLNQLRTIYAFSTEFLCRNLPDQSDYCTDDGTNLTKEKCLKSPVPALLLSTCPMQCNNCKIIKDHCPALGDHLCSVANKWVQIQK